jgi:hypothetical protein
VIISFSRTLLHGVNYCEIRGFHFNVDPTSSLYGVRTHQITSSSTHEVVSKCIHEPGNTNYIIYTSFETCTFLTLHRLLKYYACFCLKANCVPEGLNSDILSDLLRCNPIVAANICLLLQLLTLSSDVT